MKIRAVAVACLLLACKEPVTRGAALAACVRAQTGTDTTLMVTCLVDQYDWSRDSAVTVARQLHDSVLVYRQRVHDDSVAAAAAEATLTQVNDAADQAKESTRPTVDDALGMIWVGSRRTKLYYRGHCPAAKAVRGADREEFSNDKMAEREGYKRSTAPADSVCYVAPGL